MRRRVPATRAAIGFASVIASLLLVAAPPRSRAASERQNSLDWAYAVSVQRDGKLVAAGRSALGGWHFAIARYTNRGKLDPKFGTRGKLLDDFGSSMLSVASTLVIQPDGKLVAGGYAGVGGNRVDLALGRYTSAGKRDSRFGTGGRVLADLGYVRSIALQPNGKVIAAGRFGTAVGVGRFALARFTTSGRLDRTFGRAGLTVIRLGSDSEALSVAVQRDGKIVAAGLAYLGDRKEIALVRFTARGGLDASFGKRGRVLTDLASWSEARAVAILRDGKILVGGTGGHDFGLIRYSADGRRDPSFGNGGKVLTTFGVTQGIRCPDCEARDSDDQVLSLAVQPDEKIVLAGSTDLGGRFGEKFCCLANFALARYNADGTLDTTFGTEGKVVTPFPNGSTYAQDVAVQTDGRIVAAGGGAGYFALIRYMPDGRLDASFGRGGKVQMHFRTG